MIIRINDYCQNGDSASCLFVPGAWSTTYPANSYSLCVSGTFAVCPGKILSLRNLYVVSKESRFVWMWSTKFLTVTGIMAIGRPLLPVLISQKHVFILLGHRAIAMSLIQYVYCLLEDDIAFLKNITSKLVTQVCISHCFSYIAGH